MRTIPRMMTIPGLDNTARLERMRRESAEQAKRMRIRQSNGRKAMALLAKLDGKAN